MEWYCRISGSCFCHVDLECRNLVRPLVRSCGNKDAGWQQKVYTASRSLLSTGVAQAVGFESLEKINPHRLKPALTGFSNLSRSILRAYAKTTDHRKNRNQVACPEIDELRSQLKLPARARNIAARTRSNTLYDTSGKILRRRGQWLIHIESSVPLKVLESWVRSETPAILTYKEAHPLPRATP